VPGSTGPSFSGSVIVAASPGPGFSEGPGSQDSDCISIVSSSASSSASLPSSLGVCAAEEVAEEAEDCPPVGGNTGGESMGAEDVDEGAGELAIEEQEEDAILLVLFAARSVDI